MKRSNNTGTRIATSVRLLPETIQQAKEYALAHNMSLNALLDTAITTYLQPGGAPITQGENIMNKCHIRALEERPGDKAGHKWQVNYNLTGSYGWTGRKTFVTLEETRAYAKAKGWEDVSV